MVYRRGGNFGFFIIYLLFGLYLLNLTLTFIKLPEPIHVIDKFVIAIGGILIILGGINHIRASRVHNYYR